MRVALASPTQHRQSRAIWRQAGLVSVAYRLSPCGSDSAGSSSSGTEATELGACFGLLSFPSVQSAISARSSSAGQGKFTLITPILSMWNKTPCEISCEGV